MTSSTPRYGLVYPTGTDQVDDTPQIFQSMANSIESALANVDNRQTAEAVKPIVMPTLAQLQQAQAVTGQTGYVTSESANAGPWIYTGSSWLRLATDVVTGPTTVISNGNGEATAVKYGHVVELHLHWNSATSVSYGSAQLGTLPDGYKPVQNVTGTWSGRDGESQRSVSILTDGTVSYNNMGASQNTGGWSTTITYLAA